MVKPLPPLSTKFVSVLDYDPTLTIQVNTKQPASNVVFLCCAVVLREGEMAEALRREGQAVRERLCGPAHRQDERLRHQYV